MSKKASASDMLRSAMREHDSAMLSPRTGYERAIVGIMNGLTQYALAHQKTCGVPVTDDSGLGEYFAAICEGLRGLLNGETGRLDCGTLDGWLQRMASDATMPR